MKTLITIFLAFLLFSCICDEDERDSTKKRELLANKNNAGNNIAIESIVVE